MFRRKKDKGGDDEGVETVEQQAPTPASVEGDRSQATTGPYDVNDLPEGDDKARLDLGALQLAIPEGVEVRVDVSPEGQVQAATVVHHGSTMQLNAFAAPRREGIWSEVRGEIAEALRSQGGAAEEVSGPFGFELRARIPTGQPGMTQPARFLGVDGPRWFVRALITGPASTDAAQAGVLLDVFRDVVVVRGKDAMAPRDQLPLRLPREAREMPVPGDGEGGDGQGQDGAGGDGQGGDGQDFNPFERGPEITEVR